MATYLFLSDEWLDEARAIRAEFEGRGGAIEHAIRMNLIIGRGALRRGHRPRPRRHLAPASWSSTSATSTRSTSRSPSTTTSPRPSWSRATPRPASRPSCQGKIKVEGDIAKLMALQTATPDPTAAEIAARIQAMTE